MVEFRWIQMSLFLILVLLFTAVTGQYSPRFVVRVGDEVTLPCENVINSQQKCGYTTWVFTGSGNPAAVELVKLGQIGENAKAKSDRLSVTANCSLVIKKITVEDIGQYNCRQSISGQQQSQSQVFLSHINMNEQKDVDKVTLSCSVLTPEGCRHTVKWLFEGKDVDEKNKEMRTSETTECSVTVEFLPSFLKQKTKYHELFQCEVTDGYSKKVQLFDFSLQSSGVKPGEVTTSATTTIRTIENKNKRTNSAAPVNSDTPAQSSCCWWLYMIVAIGVVALVVLIVTVVRWKRTKGNKTLMDENAGLSLNPAVAESETSQDTADPEDGVSYASVSYIKKTNSKARIRLKHDDDDDDDDEDDAVTYSTVKAFSSSAGASAGASADPSDLYATINKPNK